MRSEHLQIEQRVARLEATQRVLRLTCLLEVIAFLTVAAGTFLMGHVHASGGSEILRVRGLVIEAAEGPPRALLGAPFPRVPGRKRPDGGSDAPVCLDAGGFDRLFIAAGTDPAIGG